MNKYNLLFVIFQDKLIEDGGTRRIDDLFFEFNKIIDVQKININYPYNIKIKVLKVFWIKLLLIPNSFIILYKLLFDKKLKQYNTLWFWPMEYIYLWIIPILRLFGKKIIFDYNDNFHKLNTSKNIVKKFGSFILYKIPQTLIPYISNYNILTPYTLRIQSNFIKKKSIGVTTGFINSKFKKTDNYINKIVKIGYFGGIRKDFDFDFLLNTIIKSNQKFELYLYGKNYGVNIPNDKRIICCGLIPHNVVYKKMNEMDILINSFKYNDLANCASPVKVFEYMACGKAILSANVESIKDVLINNKNSLLYEPSNEKYFLNKFKALISDKELRDRLGKQALIDSKKYTWEKIVEKIKKFICC